MKQRTYQERLTTILALYSTRTETHMSSKIALSFALYSAHTENVPYSARSENSHVMSSVNDFLHSVQRTQKTHMSNKIDFKSRTLFGTLNLHLKRFPVHQRGQGIFTRFANLSTAVTTTG